MTAALVNTTPFAAYNARGAASCPAWPLCTHLSDGCAAANEVQSARSGLDGQQASSRGGHPFKLLLEILF